MAIDPNFGAAGAYSNAEPLENNNRYPKILRDIYLGLFLAYIVIITLIIAPLFGVYHSRPISNTVLDGNLTDSKVAALAPYSVVPTFICLLLTIWWGWMATTIRTLQPYVSMARKPTFAPRDPAAYVNINILWNIVSPARKREFLLSVVALCAVLSQVC